MELFNQSLSSELSLRLLRENEAFAIYAGLWSTWWVNDTNAAAKVLLVTVLKEAGMNAPPGPIALGDLMPWVVFQLHAIDQESPIWEDATRVLSEEFKRMSEPRESRPEQQRRIVFDTVQKNHSIRAIAEPSQLSIFKLEQGGSGNETPRPPAMTDRRRVEYQIPGVADVRVFIEKPVTKQPIQQHMEADAGLVRNGTVLSRWHPLKPKDGSDTRCHQ